MKQSISIVLFRQDLRLLDNPALEIASKRGEIFPVFILDDCAPAECALGQASKTWLHHSLDSLHKSLDQTLNLYKGKTIEILEHIIDAYGVSGIFFNMCHEPWQRKQEQAILELCKKKSIEYNAFNSNYLWNPEQVLKEDGSYYRVFTAYKKKSYLVKPRKTIQNSLQIRALIDSENNTTLSDLDLISSDKKWVEKIFKAEWKVGESAAHKKLHLFIKKKLSGYKEGRNYPAKRYPSLLSPHLHFGEISPAYVWEVIHQDGSKYADNSNIESFASELIWREFSSYLLHHFPNLYKDNFNNKFDTFPWEKKSKILTAWQNGLTGFPIVDAGIRELEQTGYMHNRVRMIVASFLIKNGNIHWHKGRDWFWDHLFDADLGNNSTSWQWVAGCGVDPAPYFRIFNPVTQGEKFDKNGEYTRFFIPELKNIPDKYLFKPWTAPAEILQSAGVILGKNYPHPVLDLKESRTQALKAYKKL